MRSNPAPRFNNKQRERNKDASEKEISESRAQISQDARPEADEGRQRRFFPLQQT
jgi:hypothetical protein